MLRCNARSLFNLLRINLIVTNEFYFIIDINCKLKFLGNGKYKIKLYVAKNYYMQ